MDKQTDLTIEDFLTAFYVNLDMMPALQYWANASPDKYAWFYV